MLCMKGAQAPQSKSVNVEDATNELIQMLCCWDDDDDEGDDKHADADDDYADEAKGEKQAKHLISGQKILLAKNAPMSNT